MGQRGTDRGWRDLADAILAVALAPCCAACGELLLHPTRGPVCDSCWRSILPLTPPLCDRCGDPLPTWRVVSVPLACCPRCRRTRRLIDRARAIGAYFRSKGLTIPIAIAGFGEDVLKVKTAEIGRAHV